MAFNNTHITYTATEIANYLSGKLSPQEMHAIEKQALQDPFLADAIEGFANANADETKNRLAQIHQSIAQKQSNFTAKNASKPIKTHHKKIWLGLAASFLAVICLLTFLNNNNKLSNSNEIASVVTNKVDDKQPIINNETINEDKVDKTPVIKKSNSIQESGSTNQQDVTKTINPSTTSNSKDVLQQKERSIQINESVKDVANVSSLNQAVPVPNAKIKNNQEQKINSDAEQKESIANASIGNNNSNAFLFNKSQNFTGKIVNQFNEPVPYASVQINNSRQFVTTNAQGVFNIQPQNFNDSALTLQINAIGYQNQQANVVRDNNNLIKLNNDDKALNEVVVTNLGNKLAKKYTVSQAVKSIKIDSTLVPQGGWAAYEKYLEKNNAYSTLVVDSTSSEFKFTNSQNHSQEVVLSFAVDEDGAPIKIKVEKSLSRDASNKAVEILKNGPKWISTNTKKKNKVSIVIK